MGIPYYFASVMRKHRNVLRLLSGNVSCDNFCIDSNSVVYDVVRSIPYDPLDKTFEERVIAAVCAKLDEYIALVRPKKVFIAFDGPPPMAKMKQQRERRYKGAESRSTVAWDTVQITPGTRFMLKLDEQLERHFAHHDKNFDFFRLSTSREAGEGEHKLFQWLRSLERGGETIVYGLDSDLIILALHHLRFGAVSMLREFKEELKLLDVPKLAVQIEQVVGEGKLFDYIFLVFFLGNDFLPHFPALNLRTRGLDTLLQTYTAAIAKDKKLYDGEVIYWENVNVFVKALGSKEAREFAREYVDRNKRTVEDTPENAPLLRREVEHYINPTEPGWESRYYAALLKMDPTPGALEKVCNDYFTMLTWNTLYYSNGCPDWNVSYPHMYPPLLKHLESRVPTETRSFEQGCPKTCEELLKFVLPPSARCHVPNMSTDAAHDLFPEQYWAFCTFTWESHLLF